MIITKLSYGRTYPLGNYASERIDVEAGIDEGENIAVVFDQLKSICNAQHKINNPELHQEFHAKFAEPSSQLPEPQPIIKEKISPEQEIEEVLAGIQAANNEKELNQWLFPASKNIKTSGAYSKKKKQLGL